jgi:hypothetical protein
MPSVSTTSLSSDRHISMWRPPYGSATTMLPRPSSCGVFLSRRLKGLCTDLADTHDALDHALHDCRAQSISDQFRSSPSLPAARKPSLREMLGSLAAAMTARHTVYLGGSLFAGCVVVGGGVRPRFVSPGGSL